MRFKLVLWMMVFYLYADAVQFLCEEYFSNGWTMFLTGFFWFFGLNIISRILMRNIRSYYQLMLARFLMTRAPWMRRPPFKTSHQER